MMAAAKMVAAEDSGGRWQQRWWRMMMADDDGMQDQAADYEGKGWERAVNKKGNWHQTEKTMLFLAGVIQFFVVSVRYVVFGGGCTILCVCGVSLTKEKVVHTTPCTTYVEKKQPKTPSTSRFFGRMFKFLCTGVCFPPWKYDIVGCIFIITL